MAVKPSVSDHPKLQAAAVKRRTLHKNSAGNNKRVDYYRRRNAIIIPNPLSKYAIIDPDIGDHSLNVHRQRLDHAAAMARKLLNLSISTSNASNNNMVYRRRYDSVPNPLAPVHRATDTNTTPKSYKLSSPSRAQHVSSSSWSRSKLLVKGYRNFIARQTIQRNKERIIKMGNTMPFSNHENVREGATGNSESPRDPFDEVDTSSEKDLNEIELFSMRDHRYHPFEGSFGRSAEKNVKAAKNAMMSNNKNVGE